MRGKLRDKRAAKRDILKRDEAQRRRPSKRDNRSINRLNLVTENEDYDFDIDGEENEEEKIKIPPQK